MVSHAQLAEKIFNGPGLSSLGVPWHTQILADQLTLFQPGGINYAHLITTGTPGFSDLPTALRTPVPKSLKIIQIWSLSSLKLEFLNLVHELDFLHISNWIFAGYTGSKNQV